MTIIENDIISECKKRLLLMKQDLLNRIRSSHFELFSSEKMTGDEADQTMALLEENNFLSNQARLRHNLVEVESALGRIETGLFGICEETQEPIEIQRLLAIPYTRLSIEGAEIREAMHRKFAR